MKRFFYLSLLILISSCRPVQQISIAEAPIIEKTDSMDTIISDYETFQKSLNETESPWPDLSEDRKSIELSSISSLLNRLQSMDTSSLSSEDLINQQMLSLILQDWKHGLEYESHLIPLNAEGGFLAGVIYGIQGRPITNQEQADSYTKKLLALPDYFDQRIANLKEGQQKGKSSPQLITGNCIKLIDHLLATPVEEQFFLKTVDPLFKDNIRQIIEGKVLPAYSTLRQYLQDEYLPNAPELVGVSHISGGKGFYEERVRYFTTFDISPQEVFDTGQREVARIKLEMQNIIEELEFDGGFPEFLAFLRTDEQFYPKSGRELLNRAAWITKEMEGELPKYFGHLPRMPLTVKPVPDALAPNYTGGRYSPGSYKNNRAGQYWVNTYKLESRPYYVLPALSLHEGVPGHHLQIMLASELEGLPEFRKTYISAFGEGWGLYSEYLGKEAGMYKTPYEEFGALTYEMWRACRLVVDPGMHYLGWTREQAVEFMASNTALSMHEVNTEIDRYIGWPAQAVSYKMGELKIRDLRKKAEQRLGDSFDIKAFHDTVLKNGSIPLISLEAVVNEFIELELMDIQKP